MKNEKYDLVGKIVDSIVTIVLQYGALLKLDGTDIQGYLHISQVSNDFIKEHLNTVISVGQSLNVQILNYDSKHQSYEVSVVAATRRKLLENSGFGKGTIVEGKVLASTELGCRVCITDEISAYIDGGKVGWDIYDVMFKAGFLKVDSIVKLVILDIDKKSRGFNAKIYAGNPENFSPGSVVRGKIILTRVHIKKREKLHQVIYVLLDSNEIAHCYANNTYDFENTFRIGDNIALQIKNYLPFQHLLDASLLIEDDKSYIPVGLGKCRGLIIKTSPMKYWVLVASNVIFSLRTEEIYQDVLIDGSRLLQPGDIVEINIKNNSKEFYERRAQFIRLLDRPFVSDSDISMIDLEVEYKKGGKSGYVRDRNFRNQVLEFFDNSCCICGVRHIFGLASAMEASHIIPRSNRGADVLANGLCLCSLHHWAFDQGFITLDEANTVIVCDDIMALGQEGLAISEFHGRQANFPEGYMPSYESIRWHRRNIFIS